MVNAKGRLSLHINIHLWEWNGDFIFDKFLVNYLSNITFDVFNSKDIFTHGVHKDL